MFARQGAGGATCGPRGRPGPVTPGRSLEGPAVAWRSSPSYWRSRILEELDTAASTKQPPTQLGDCRTSLIPETDAFYGKVHVDVKVGHFMEWVCMGESCLLHG